MSRELIKTALVSVLSAMIGAVATITVGYVTFHTQNRQIDVRMIELALDIIAGKYDREPEQEQEKESAIPARRFAIRVLSHYSRVPIEKKRSGRMGQGARWHSEGFISA
ncbi:MAG: hypothetical protein ABJM26_20535 [Anderseniella sp.]